MKSIIVNCETKKYLMNRVAALGVAVASAGILFVSEPIIGLNDAEAKSCQILFTSNEGRAANLERAKRRARVKWRAQVRIKYGWQYNNWDNAKVRRYNKRRKLGVWRVAAKGRPCTG